MQLPYGDLECFVWYVALAHYLACVNLELVSLFRSCLLQQAASWARGVCVAVASSQCSACSARSGCKFITLTFGHSCELESPKLKAGPWCLDLRRLGRMAAESEPRARGARGLGFKLDPLWLSAPYGFGCDGSVGFPNGHSQ